MRLAVVCAHLEEQSWVLLKEVGRLTPQRLLKLLGIRAWHAVPRLSLAPVHCGRDASDKSVGCPASELRRRDALWLMLCV